MGWFSKLFRRNRSEGVFAEFSEPAFFSGAANAAPDVARQSGGALAGDADHLGFATSGGRFLGGAESQSGASRRYRQAFTPSQPVADVRRLAGRTALIRRVIRSIEDQDLHVVLYGDRGIGKTSVLKVIQGLATRANYLVHYVSCGHSASFSEVFRSLASRIPMLYDSTVDPTEGDRENSRSLADHLPEGEFSVSQLTEVLSRIEGARILLILDEFDRSDIDGFRRPIGELIKNLSDRSIRVQLLIGGVAGNLSELVAHVPSIRRNIAGIGVPNLIASEVDEMVDIAEVSGNVRFDALARERLAEVSAGLPYLVGLIGQHAIFEAADAGDDWIARAHIDRAVGVGCEEIASRLSLQCNFALERLSRGHRKLVERAAVEAVGNGGLIIDPVITAELRTHTGDVGDIVHPLADDPRGGWRFNEDGAASLVWLRLMQPAAAVPA